MSTFNDYKRNSDNNSIFAVLSNPCFYSVVLYRISNFFYRKKMFPLAKLVWFFNRIIFCVDIDCRAQIGQGFILVHGLGVVIGCDVNIGNNVKIYQGVTLGGNGATKYINDTIITQPQIGDNCIIYTNSCIFGPVIVKNDTTIKACQVIFKDII